MKRVTAFCLAFLLCLYSAAAASPALVGKEAVLYCAENDQVLLNKEMDKPVHPASITKLMTALLVLESGLDLSSTTTVSYDAVHSIERGSTHIALDTDEQVTLEQMMYAMLLTSANDAANVLAEAVAGSQAAFAQQMTQRAKELGCRHTNFVNAHGLDDPLHYTTAYDMARITDALLDYDLFLTISGTQVYHMPPTNLQPEARAFWNKQNMLNPQSKFYDKSVIAGKNGYTTGAGHTLVTVARREGVTLIAVTMGSVNSRYDKHKDTAAMFQYGFENFTKVDLTAQEIAAAAERLGLSPNPQAILPAIALLPAGETAKDLVYTSRGNVLGASCSTGQVLSLKVPQMTEDTPAPASADPENVAPAPSISGKEDVGAGHIRLPRMLRYGGFLLLGALIMMAVFTIYRTVRIRRQRRRIRALRQRRARNQMK